MARLHALALTASIAMLLTACTGTDSGDAAETSPAATSAASDDMSSDGALVSIDGEPADLTMDICAVGGPYGTEDDRQFSAVGPGGFPSFALELFAPDMYSATYSGEAASYRSNDMASFDVTITADGAQGSVVLADTSGQSDDITVTFDFACADADSTTETDSSGDDGTDDAAGSDDDASGKTGYVDWAGSRSELDDEDFDPMAGTGLCETQDVTGLEDGDYYRISTNLDDGTDFYLTSQDGLQLGDTFSPIDVTSLSVTQDGRTVSGSAQTPDGAIEFSFTC